MTEAPVKPTVELPPSKKPLCAVRGSILPGAMCGRVIVGMKYCGAQPGTCQHQREEQEPANG